GEHEHRELVYFEVQHGLVHPGLLSYVEEDRNKTDKECYQYISTHPAAVACCTESVEQSAETECRQDDGWDIKFRSVVGICFGKFDPSDGQYDEEHRHHHEEKHVPRIVLDDKP